ncbi:uncharacterized protein KGF55_000439 [Candida pseudojiufengensis]|uniref:uncharacterized protein n=1 Tax=Candida pseudojiufengensis TaxID=497109 RepID=UPI0022240CF9|nr:uncharacterized protein KGF55_000439 [Candida pseudojiufengensis]KAI5967029.1 hypothetical protein KGF55_000439 [Candida pseudojiufengensis]
MTLITSTTQFLTNYSFIDLATYNSLVSSGATVLLACENEEGFLTYREVDIELTIHSGKIINLNGKSCKQFALTIAGDLYGTNDPKITNLKHPKLEFQFYARQFTNIPFDNFDKNTSYMGKTYTNGVESVGKYYLQRIGKKFGIENPESNPRMDYFFLFVGFTIKHGRISASTKLQFSGTDSYLKNILTELKIKYVLGTNGKDCTIKSEAYNNEFSKLVNLSQQSSTRKFPTWAYFMNSRNANNILNGYAKLPVDTYGEITTSNINLGTINSLTQLSIHASATCYTLNTKKANSIKNYENKEAVINKTISTKKYEALSPEQKALYQPNYNTPEYRLRIFRCSEKLTNRPKQYYKNFTPYFNPEDMSILDFNGEMVHIKFDDGFKFFVRCQLDDETYGIPFLVGN